MTNLPPSLDNKDALLEIQELLDGVEWNSDTCDAIAQVMDRAGYRIRDLDDRDLNPDPRAANNVLIQSMNTKPGVDMQPLTEALTGLKEQFAPAAAAASGPLQDHERIWLEPAPGDSEGRTWCEDKFWPENEGEPEPTEYVRADLVIRKDQIDLSLLPKIASFEIVDDNDALVEAEGGRRFVHERDAQMLHDWAAAAVYQIGVEQTVNQQLQGKIADLTVKNEDLVNEMKSQATILAQRLGLISELQHSLQSLVNDIRGMTTDPDNSEAESEGWFGPFGTSTEDMDGDVKIEWPNLLISTQDAEKLLKEIES